MTTLAWEINAYNVRTYFGGEVDNEELFYVCPECGERIYNADWGKSDSLIMYICPICKFGDDDSFIFDEEEEYNEYWGDDPDDDDYWD